MRLTRFFALLLTLCLSFTAIATAETSGDALVEMVRQSVLERSTSQVVEIEMGREIAPDNLGGFMVMDAVITSADAPDSLRVAFYIDMRQTDDSDGSIGMSDYDFVLLTRNADASSSDDLRFHMPNAVYEVGGQHFQQLCWPVLLYPGETVSLLIEYVVPNDTVRLGLIATNMLTDEPCESAHAVGAIYALSISRNLADFNLHNQTDSDITEFYVYSEDNRWSSDFIAAYNVGALPAGKWIHCPVDDDRSTSWSIQLALSDGTIVHYIGIDLRDVCSLILTESDGVYSMRIE